MAPVTPPISGPAMPRDCCCGTVTYSVLHSRRGWLKRSICGVTLMTRALSSKPVGAGAERGVGAAYAPGGGPYGLALAAAATADSSRAVMTMCLLMIRVSLT